MASGAVCHLSHLGKLPFADRQRRSVPMDVCCTDFANYHGSGDVLDWQRVLLWVDGSG
jgi:hypothetical protein